MHRDLHSPGSIRDELSHPPLNECQTVEPERLLSPKAVSDLVKLYPDFLRRTFREPKAKPKVDSTKSKGRSDVLNEQPLLTRKAV